MTECARLGIEVIPFLAKQMRRRQLPLSRDALVCGDVDMVEGAMKQLGIPPPQLNDYPDSLHSRLGRKVWRSSIARLESAVFEGGEVFAKPAGRRKLFTGRIFSSSTDLNSVSGISRQEPIWCSEIVHWIAEYRVYVIHAKVVAIDHYRGDAAVGLNEAAVTEAIDAFTKSGEAPAAYGIDFGVLETGDTALVEVNDGYALGAYAIAGEPYTRLLLTRWLQLAGFTP